MIELVSPAQVGLSATRLQQIAHHFNCYVDEGKLPGYLVFVARREQPAYLHHFGLCDVEYQKAVAEETIGDGG
jgi:hypothetical protein